MSGSGIEELLPPPKRDRLRKSDLKSRKRQELEEKDLSSWHNVSSLHSPAIFDDSLPVLPISGLPSHLFSISK